ncbi:MAG: hypothetical protein QOF04_3218 [Solirubrobacteraceae bacterium]|nr:hypothetical protein [Solirubrobacteraceae bacterium]
MADLFRGSQASTPAELEERMDADRRGRPYVLYRDGDRVQHIRSLDGRGDRLTVGRDPASDVPLVWDADVSRAHAALERLGIEWAIVDDGPSRNGTFVNGERVRSRRRLGHGDVMRCGHTTLLFRAPSPAAAPEAVPPPRRPPHARAPRSARRAPRRAVLVGVGVVVAALLAAQAALPAIAEHRVRAAFGARASGVHVDVRALPAVKLLWHRADRVKIAVDRLSPRASGGGTVGDMLGNLGVARRLDLRVGTLLAHGLALRRVTVRKDGDAVVASTDVDLRALDGVLPAGLRVRPVTAADDRIRLHGTLGAFGQRRSARADLLAAGGRIVVRPEGIPPASLLTVAVFSDPRISVDRLASHPSADGMVLTARAHLR